MSVADSWIEWRREEDGVMITGKYVARDGSEWDTLEEASAREATLCLMFPITNVPTGGLTMLTDEEITQLRNFQPLLVKLYSLGMAYKTTEPQPRYYEAEVHYPKAQYDLMKSRASHFGFDCIMAPMGLARRTRLESLSYAKNITGSFVSDLRANGVRILKTRILACVESFVLEG